MKSTPVTIDPAVTLLNCGQLAGVLNVSKAFITAMRHCGFPMPGNRATVTDAHAWLKAHPTFAASKRTVQQSSMSAAQVTEYAITTALNTTWNNQ